MGYKIRSYFPNLLTLISLSSGFVSILLSSQGQVSLAALFILVSVGLDFLDGYFARKLAVDSNFGIQLDSLADMVCFGVAPAVLVFSHLMIRNGNSLWFVPFLLVYICAGAFRLARYNLLPAKQSSNEGSVGLTITSSGIIISLAVLSDLSYVEYSYPLAVYLALVIILCCLMVSRMILPAPSWFLPGRGFLIVYILGGAALLAFMPIFTSLLVFCLVLTAASFSRSVYTMFFLNHPGQLKGRE